MCENISLVLQTHEKISIEDAQKISRKALKDMYIENICDLRYEKCSEKEIFYTQLIRASVIKNAKIIIDQPFVFLPDEMDLNFLSDALDTLFIAYDDVMIIDLLHQVSHYKESLCHIEK